MPILFDVLYREYCRARLAEMRQQLLVNREVPDANDDAGGAAGCVDPGSSAGDGRRTTAHQGSHGARN